MQTVFQDIRYALRQLRKSPGFFSIVAVTLGLGIGANTAIFSMVNWLVLKPLPITDPQQMYFLAFSQSRENSENQFSYPEFAEIQQQTKDIFSGATPFIFGGLEGAQNSSNGLTVDGVTKPIETVYVGGNFFSLLGITPALGRFISPEESSASNAPVVLSYNYWQTRFGGNSAVVGKSAWMNGHAVTIIGVTRKGFLGPAPIIETQAYLPLSMYSIERGVASDFLTNAKVRNMLAFMRVKPGTRPEQIQSTLSVVGRNLLRDYPRGSELSELHATPLRPPGIITGTNPLPKLAALFLALAAMVLALACVNVANLLLARTAVRQREMAVRAALGGARGRLVRQLLTEGGVIAACGCLVGVLLGLGANRMLAAMPIQSDLPFVLDFGFDWHVFTYAFAVAALTGIIVIMAPAVRVWNSNLREVLHEGGRTSLGGRQRLRGVLVASQVAGSLTLLIIAGLFVRSLVGVQMSDLGFDPGPVLNVTLDPNQIGYSQVQSHAFYLEVLERTRALPGVQSASLASAIPLGDTIPSSDLMLPGQQTSAGQPSPHAEYNAVSSDYFKTMGMALQRGRDFTDADKENSSHVAVINQSMAERYWPGQDPIGRSFAMASDPTHPATIVGVVQNSRMGQLYGPFGPIFYVPILQNYSAVQTLQVRSRLDPKAMIPAIQAVAKKIAPAIPVYSVRTMTEALHGGNGLLLFQLGASLAAALGILGLILAVVGVYGVMSYTVSQRTQEIGVRVALGAQKRDIFKVVGLNGLLIVAGGMISGLVAAFAVGNMVGDFLVGIGPSDPITYVGVSAVIAVVACMACYIPARRAAKVDPMAALRYE